MNKSNTYLAFLRAINVGNRRLKMVALRELFEELGLAQVETFIASGNVIFETPPISRATLTQQIEDHLAERLGYSVETFLRTPEEVAAMATLMPFSDLEADDAIYVTLFAEALPPETDAALAPYRSAVDQFYCTEYEIYWRYRRPLGESQCSNDLFEKTAGASATTRNLNTFKRLTAKYPPPV